MKKITLARFKYSPFGGAENYLARLCAALKNRALPHSVISTNWDGGNIVSVPKILPSFMRVLLFSLLVCIKKRQDEILFSLERVPCADVYRAGDGVHKAWMDTRLQKGESRLKIFLNPLQSTYLWLERRTFQNAKKIIANSNFVKQDIIKYYRTEQSKIEIVYNGVPQNAINPAEARQKIEAEFALKKEQKIILFVGSGFYRKGVAEFLQLISQLCRDDVTAIIVGKEKNISTYKKLAEQLGVNAIFTGARRDADVFYASADLFLFPTLYEPFSNVCLEAMAGGCAVITTAQNGAAEILDEKFVMKSPNDKDILGVLHRLLDEHEFLTETKAANKAKSLEFSIERNLEETLGVLESL